MITYYVSFERIKKENWINQYLILPILDSMKSKLRHEKQHYHVTELQNVYRDTYPF